MGTMPELIEREKISADVERADSNPNLEPSSDMPRHWLVTLEREGKKLAVPFSQGSAHTEPPTAADVLDCLASDASGLVNARDFFDWADEFGYLAEGPEEARRARKTYHAIDSQTAALRDWAGTLLFDELLFETERL